MKISINGVPASSKQQRLHHHQLRVPHHFQNRLVRTAIAAVSVESSGALSLQNSQFKAETLKQWVVNNTKPSNLPTDLVPKPDPSTGGFSMVTLEPVERGQVLVRVPRSLLLTADVAASDPEYGHLVTEGPLTEWQALVLALLCERAKGEKSFWAPYLAQLPNQVDHPLAWGPERLEWLKGSSMKTVLQARQKQVHDDCEVLQLVGANQLGLAQQWQKEHGSELVTVSSVTWAAATLLSRAFSIDMADDDSALEGDMSYFGGWSGTGPQTGAATDVLAIVPWADTLSHCSQAGPESCLRYCTELQAASLCAHRPYAIGEEVFDSYGPALCPSDLLLDYGFVDSTNTNHRVEVDPQDIVVPTSKCAKVLLAALAIAHSGADPNASTEQEHHDLRFPITCKGPDATLLAWVRAALSSDADLIRAGWRVKSGPKDVELACRVMGRLIEPSAAAAETKVLQAIKSHLLKHQTSYPSSMEQDQAELQQQDTLPPRRAALQALVSEKTALAGALQSIDTWLEQISQGVSVEELYVTEYEDEFEDDEDYEGDGWGDRNSSSATFDEIDASELDDMQGQSSQQARRSR